MGGRDIGEGGTEGVETLGLYIFAVTPDGRGQGGNFHAKVKFTRLLPRSNK